ncbi:MAG: phospholipase [Gemmatimonadales bacterium]
MKPHHLTVKRTARYFTLGPDGAPVRELWIVLHGYAQLASRFLRAFAPLDDGATVMAAPEALSRFYLETRLDGGHGSAIGATWLTREDRVAEIGDVHGYLDQLVGVLRAAHRPERLIVLGFSQGSAAVARWAVTSSETPDQLILWGAPLAVDVAPDALAARRAGHPVVLVAGDEDTHAPAGVLEAQAAALVQAGATATAVRFAGGHTIDAAALRRIAGRD